MVKVKKTGKKGFYDVKAPLTSAKISLYASSAEELNGKTIKLDLTRTLRGKSYEMKVRIKEDAGNLTGDPVSLELAGSYIRRMMRRGADYVEDSFDVECRDKKARIKPFMITRNKVSRAIRNSLRKTAKQYLEGYCKTRNAQELLSELMTNKIQKELSLKLKKIYPLALCEIRVFNIEEEKKVIGQAPENK
jgi:ribosomal protein S3AE